MLAILSLTHQVFEMADSSCWARLNGSATEAKTRSFSVFRSPPKSRTTRAADVGILPKCPYLRRSSVCRFRWQEISGATEHVPRLSSSLARSHLSKRSELERASPQGEDSARRRRA